MLNNLISIIFKSKTLLVLLKHVYCSTSSSDTYVNPFVNHVKFKEFTTVKEGENLLKKTIRNLEFEIDGNPLKFGVQCSNEDNNSKENVDSLYDVMFLGNGFTSKNSNMDLLSFIDLGNYIFVINNSQINPEDRVCLAVLNYDLNPCLSYLTPSFNIKTWINFNQFLSILPNNKIEFISAKAVDKCDVESVLEEEEELSDRREILKKMFYFPLKDEKIIVCRFSDEIYGEEYGILVYKMNLMDDGSFVLMSPELLIYKNVIIGGDFRKIESSRFYRNIKVNLCISMFYNFEQQIEYITEDELTNLISKDTLKKYQNFKIVKDKEGKSQRGRLNPFGIGKEGCKTSLIGKALAKDYEIFSEGSQFTIYTDFDLPKESSHISDQSDSVTNENDPITSKNSDIGEHEKVDVSKKTETSKDFDLPKESSHVSDQVIPIIIEEDPTVFQNVNKTKHEKVDVSKKTETSKDFDSSKSSYGNIIIVSIILILLVVVIILICYFLKNRKEINEIESTKFFS